MKYLFEPAIRLMNRLKYAYKFGIIGLLIVLQSSVLIYMLVSELSKNIENSQRERIGVKYVAVLITALHEGQAYRSLDYTYRLGDVSLEEKVKEQAAKVDSALAEAEEIDKQTGDQMDTAWKLAILQQDWSARKQNAMAASSEQAHVAFDLDSRWLNEITDLMQHIGYHSNLAMDSDFDTSYLIDSVLRKLPVLIEHIGAAQGLAAELDNRNITAENKNRLLQVVGLMHSALEQADYNNKIIFRHNEELQSKLIGLSGSLADNVPIFAWNAEQKAVGQQGMLLPQQIITTAGNQAMQNAAAFHKKALEAVDNLLVLRIEKYLQYRNGVVLFTISILLIVCYLFSGFDMSVRKGVYQLGKVMTAAGKGNLEVRGKIYSKDEMGSLTAAINATLDSLQKMYQEVQESHAQLEKWNQELEQKVADRTAALRNLLDYAGQGFLSFGETLRVGKEYSAECRALFERDIVNELVAGLIYPEDRDQQVFLEAVFAKTLQEENENSREMYFSLLPGEINLGDKYIGITYKIIENSAIPNERRIMMILTNRTLEKAMENRMQAERDVLSMIVHVVTHASDFFAAVNQYTSFCQTGMPDLLQEDMPADVILANLFRIIHTFKGTFGQLHMANAMNKLHDMEGMLDTIRARELSSLSARQLADKLAAYTPQEMLAWLQPDLVMLRDKLGESFFQRENVLVIDNARLIEIEEKVESMLSGGECRQLLQDLRHLRYKPFRELLSSYPEYICGLAERHEKAVHLFPIEGDDTMVDPLRYYDFIKSLGHVFRNCVVHGLETFDERLEAGKDEIGSITCQVTETAEGLRLIIADDGRGMDPANIRDIAINKGLCTQEEAEAMPEAEWIQLIFADGFSGADKVDNLAGRGVGLSAVRSELEKIGGTVEVQSTFGKGTSFAFFLPRPKDEGSSALSIRLLAKPILNAIEERLAQIGLDIKEISYASHDSKLSLRNITTFLGVKGFPNAKILFSADQQVVQYLVNKTPSTLETAAERKLEYIFAQYAQEFFRLAVKEIPQWPTSATAEALLSIWAEDASAKYSQAETATFGMTTELGSISLSLVY